VLAFLSFLGDLVVEPVIQTVAEDVVAGEVQEVMDERRQDVVTILKRITTL
jgi:hypothetical protein